MKPHNPAATLLAIFAAMLAAPLAPVALADHHESDSAAPQPVARYDLPPRKVIIGTTMTPWYSDYPGLAARIAEMRDLIDTMAADAQRQYGRPIDIALFTEYALTSGATGTAQQIAIPVNDALVNAFADKARQYHTYIVLNGIFLDDPDTKACSNAAVVIDPDGNLMGRYAKAHPVLDDETRNGQPVFEGGVLPGTAYNTFEFDAGRVGIQICYDVEFPEGWQALADKGVDLVLYPSQSPQTIRTGYYARTHEYWVVSSTFRNNASFFYPGTGLIAAQITGDQRTLVHEIDLSYLVLPWSSTLRDGAAFREAYGDRVGFHYSRSEDHGVFWSNDPDKPIGQMARELGLLNTADELQRARAAQDQVRGGPAR